MFRAGGRFPASPHPDDQFLVSQFGRPRAMPMPVEAVLLRVFVGTDDRHGERALYEAIVQRAREMGMAGATVLPGPEGFGRSRHIRSELSVDAGPRQPMVVEIVDTDEQIDRFLPILDGMMESGLVTLEKARAIRYRARHDRPGKSRTAQRAGHTPPPCSA